MPTPKIVAVATATPPHRFTQAELLALAGYTDERRRGFFARSEIEGRHLWIDPRHFRPHESVDELNARFTEGALARHRCVDHWTFPSKTYSAGPASV